MIDPSEMFNPFPGLRPFGSEEDHLFFGRETIVDQLLIRLRETRFLGVIGSSGCGKSSLVRAGLIPSLHSGYMTSAGSSWRVAVMRPGTDPIGNLGEALSQPDVLGHQTDVDEAPPVLTEVTLRRSNLGLVECVRLARLPPEDNLVIIVDQFEELFRFKRGGQSEGARDEAVAFVKRLLSAADQQDLPIYVVLTMRSDFIGECNEYPGLPEAINEGQFLVPRMTREQLRSAIAGPILVAGGQIAPRLLVRMLNDVGDDPDRLPILQHALMLTWKHWQEVGAKDEPIDVQHYEAIGTMEHALSSHADEAYEELGSDYAKDIAAKVFKALTDTSSDSRGVRRPTTLGQLCTIVEAGPAEILAIVDAFRSPDRSFLMPPIGVPIASDTFIDISHESLMRVWERLIGWTKEENASTRTYMRLARTAARYEQGTGGLWRDPDLAIALKWHEQTNPTEAWATRYNPAFEQAMSFLDESEAERDRLAAERRNARRKKLQTAWGVSIALLVFAVYAFFQQQRAEQEQRRAEQNFQLAVRAVDEMLTDVALEESLAEIPQTEELRQRLLEKARMFFETLREDKAADPNLRLETAVAQVRLGKLYEYQGQRDRAEAAHSAAIEQLQDLRDEFEDQPMFQLRLGEAYNELGEQLRPYDSASAETAYDNSLELLQNLVATYPDNLENRYELGRTYNNRGILIGSQAGRVAEAEESFGQAITIFETLRDERDDRSDSLRLARTLNNLAVLLKENSRYDEAATAYRDAINQMDELTNAYPEKREYREGLARMHNNLGNLHLMRPQPKLEIALQANADARVLFESLATPVRGLRNELANSHNTRGRILFNLDRIEEAARAYETALRQFELLEQDIANFEDDPGLNSRYGNALANFAILRAKQGYVTDAVRLVLRAVGYHENAVDSLASSSTYKNNLASAYWLLADIQLKSGNFTDAIEATESLARVTTDKDLFYGAAVLYARATDIALDDRTRTAAQRGEIGESYMARTVSLLGSAIAAGYPLERLEADIDHRFSDLRNREDFRQLLIDAEKAQK